MSSALLAPLFPNDCSFAVSALDTAASKPVVAVIYGLSGLLHLSATRCKQLHLQPPVLQSRVA